MILVTDYCEAVRERERARAGALRGAVRRGVVDGEKDKFGWGEQDELGWGDSGMMQRRVAEMRGAIECEEERRRSRWRAERSYGRDEKMRRDKCI